MFQTILKKLFDAEGFFSDHPNDLGGATKYGITIASLARYRNGAASKQDVQDLTEADAMKFYFECFWAPLRCEEYKSALLAHIIFDQAVNRGLTVVVRDIQRILQNEFDLHIQIDGVMGNHTVGMLNKVDASLFATYFIFSAQDQYCRIVQKNPSQLVFLAGWINRTQNLFLEVVKELKNYGTQTLS